MHSCCRPIRMVYCSHVQKDATEKTTTNIHLICTYIHMKKKNQPYLKTGLDAHMYFCIAKDALNIVGVRHLIFRVQRLSQLSSFICLLLRWRVTSRTAVTSEKPQVTVFLHSFLQGKCFRLSASLAVMQMQAQTSTHPVQSPLFTGDVFVVYWQPSGQHGHVCVCIL